MELGRFLSSISWDQIQRIRTTKDGQFYSFAVETDSKKRIVTLGVGPNTTTITVSDIKGRILAHVVQEGDQMAVYSPKSSKRGPMEELGPVYFSTAAEDIGEKGI